jgi:hypothetical protein
MLLSGEGRLVFEPEMLEELEAARMRQMASAAA